ncbi:hypothetical protein VKT23_014457 [Stygiomarasmius scandens]
MYAVFLDRDWKEIGTRWNLRDVLSAITAIPVEVFEGRDIDEFSIAQRMSWAAYRETTRPEDQAYCLMGIFNVNMPPIYGEGGAKAFMRLQQEIIKISDDRSIFAWVSESNPVGTSDVRGLLARSPKEFRTSGEVAMFKTDIEDKSSFSFANNGLRIHLPISPASTELSDAPGSSSVSSLRTGSGSLSEDHIFMASLHCCCPSKNHGDRDNSYLYIYLRKIGKQQYVRCHSNRVVVIPSPPRAEDLKEVIVKENPLPRRASKNGVQFSEVRVELSHSAQCSLQSWFFKGKGGKSVLPMFRGVFTAEAYRDRRTAELFSLVFNIRSCPTGTRKTIETVAIVQGKLNDYEQCPSDYPNKGLPVDRVDFSIQTGIVHVRLQMTGNLEPLGRVLEIDHISTGGGNSMVLQLPNSGCTVPLAVMSSSGSKYSKLLSFESVFPPDFFDRGLNSGYQGYISMHYGDVNMPRLLTYRRMDSQRNEGFTWIHVALGFDEYGEVWTHVLVSRRYEDKTPNLKQIWKSLLNYGEWKLGSTSASAMLETWFSRWNITAIVQKTESTPLQLGPHSLLLDIERYSDTE